MANPPSAADIVSWTIEAGLRETDVAPLIEGFAERLARLVPGMARLFVGLPTLHPTFISGTWIWERGSPLRCQRQVAESWQDADWLQSPIYFALQNNVNEIRCDLTDPTQAARFPVFQTFAAGGHTDYLLRLIEFEAETHASGIEGVIVTFVSDDPAGFTSDDLAVIDRALPALSLAAFRLTVSEVARNLLSAYVGADAGRRVLGGKVMRGDVERIRAAIFFADLRHFTDISERLAADEMISWLNAGLAAVGDPTVQHGGQILKFLGDGLLAIFPVAGDDADACRRALAAAREAPRQIGALANGGPDYEVDIALHVGEVGYGNIGASDRLDFTVIGPTVNEVSRMEALCDALDVHLVMSERFAACVDLPLRDLGLHRLRGVNLPRRLLTLTE